MTRHQSVTCLPASLSAAHVCSFTPSGGPEDSACAEPAAAVATTTSTQSSAAARAPARARMALVERIEREQLGVGVGAREILGVTAVLGGRVERVEDEPVAEVDLHRADAAVVVTHQAAAAAEGLQPLPEAGVVLVEAEQAQRALGLALGLDPEAERRADQRLELVDVAEHLGGQQRRDVLSPAEARDPVDERAAGGVGEQHPRLVEAEHGVAARGAGRAAPRRGGGAGGE